MIFLKTALLFAIAFFALLAQDKPAAPFAVKPLTEAQSLKFENLLLREQLAQQAVDKARADQQALYADVCKSAGLEAAECSVDLAKQTVTKKAAAPAPK